MSLIKAHCLVSIAGTYRNGYMPIFLIISMSWMQEKNMEYKTYRISQRDLSYWAYGVLVEVRLGADAGNGDGLKMVQS